MTVFNVYGTDSKNIAITVSDFALSVLRTFQTQLGTAFVKEMLNLFINVIGRYVLTL